MGKNLNRPAKLATCIAALMALIVLSAYCVARFEQNRADKLVARLSNVTPGETSHQSVQDAIQDELLLNRISNACEVDSLKGCDQFAFSNKLMAYLHMAPARWVWVTLEYRNGVVISKSVQFAEEPRRSAITQQILRGLTSQSVGVGASGRTVIDNTSDPRNAMVKISDDDKVSLDQRQRDWQVNLSCLSRVGACSDLHAILPRSFPQE